MRIIGCDLHARQQFVAMLNTETGEVVNRTLMHEGDEVREFYSQLPQPVLVGIEAIGPMQWFLKLLDELGEGLRLLGQRGFPFELTTYGLTPAEIRLPFRWIRFLRNRTSSFDLMHLLGVERRIYGSALAGG